MYFLIHTWIFQMKIFNLWNFHCWAEYMAQWLSLVKCTNYSQKGSGCDTKNPQNHSQHSITLVSGESMPSFGVHGYTCSTQTCMQTKHSYV